LALRRGVHIFSFLAIAGGASSGARCA